MNPDPNSLCARCLGKARRVTPKGKAVRASPPRFDYALTQHQGNLSIKADKPRCQDGLSLTLHSLFHRVVRITPNSDSSQYSPRSSRCRMRRAASRSTRGRSPTSPAGSTLSGTSSATARVIRPATDAHEDQPMYVNTTAIVSMNPWARIATQKLRRDSRYAPPSTRPAKPESTTPAYPL